MQVIMILSSSDRRRLLAKDDDDDDQFEIDDIDSHVHSDEDDCFHSRPG